MTATLDRPTVPATFDTMDLMVEGFLARFTSPATRTSYAGDIELWRRWCATHGLDPLAVERGHVEMFARHLEADRGNGTATVHRRLVCLRSFYRVLAQDRRIAHSPAEYVRLPNIYRDRSQYTNLSAGEVGAMLRAADEARPADAALTALMGLSGLRVSEACSLDVDSASRFEKGHRMVTVHGKGGKIIGLPVPAPVGRRIDVAICGRDIGPMLTRRDGTRMTRRSAARVVARVAKAAGITKAVTPHDLRAAAITIALEAGVPLREVQYGIGRHADPRTTEIYDRGQISVDRHAAYRVASAVAA